MSTTYLRDSDDIASEGRASSMKGLVVPADAASFRRRWIERSCRLQYLALAVSAYRFDGSDKSTYALPTESTARVAVFQ